MGRFEKAMMGIGGLLIAFFGSCLDSQNMMVPVIGVAIGIAFLGIGELKWYVSQR